MGVEEPCPQGMVAALVLGKDGQCWRLETAALGKGCLVLGSAALGEDEPIHDRSTVLGGGEQGPRCASLGKGCAASRTAAPGLGEGSSRVRDCGTGGKMSLFRDLRPRHSLVERCAGPLTAAQGGAT